MVRNFVSVKEIRFEVVASHLWMDNFERAFRTAYKCVKSHTIDGVFCHPRKKMQSVIINIERNKYVRRFLFLALLRNSLEKCGSSIEIWVADVCWPIAMKWNGIQSNTNVESFKTFTFINEEQNRQSKSIYRRFSTLSQKIHS